MRIEELEVTPCGSRCVWACQSIVSSSRQMVEVLRKRHQTTQLRHYFGGGYKYSTASRVATKSGLSF
jgi:hypothetical protein